MSMYKLAVPCKLIDVNGNAVDSEHVVLFDNKEVLIEYVAGDTDGDKYGSSLIKPQKHDNKLYTQIGKMCNRISNLLQQENENREKQIISSVCRQIMNYITCPSVENAKVLYPMLQKTHVEFLNYCYFGLKDIDVDGDRPWEQEWCDKFVGMVRSNAKIFANVASHSANCVIDAWKE